MTAALQRSREGKALVTVMLDGAPGASVEVKPSDLREGEHSTLITRLEHRLARLEDRTASIVADIEHAQREIIHAREDLGQPFPQAAQLAAAQERAREINEQLERMAAQLRADTGDAEPAAAGSRSAERPLPEPETRHSDVARDTTGYGYGQQTGKGTAEVAAYASRGQDRPADWRDQLMASAREQWTPRVPGAAGPDAARECVERDAPETDRLGVQRIYNLSWLMI